MGRIGFFLLGAIFFFSCGTAVTFKYKFYNVTPINVWDYPNATLLGAKSSDDLPLKECKPVKNSAGKYVQKCVVVFYSELNKLIIDYKETKQKNIDLERRCR